MVFIYAQFLKPHFCLFLNKSQILKLWYHWHSEFEIFKIKLYKSIWNIFLALKQYIKLLKIPWNKELNLIVFIFNKFVFRTAGRSDHRVPGRVHQQGGAGDDCRLSGGLAQVPYTQYHLYHSLVIAKQCCGVGPILAGFGSG